MNDVSLWIRRPWLPGMDVRSGEPTLRLICLPYAGGGASIYRAWAQRLSPAIDVCPVQLPGRENRLREAPWTSLPLLIDALAVALEPLLHRPWALFGHSVGALIAFELARRLARDGRSPGALLVSAFPAPPLPSRVSPLHRLTDDDLVSALRQIDGVSGGVLDSPALRDAFLRALRADIALAETYVYRAEQPLTCPITAFGGEQDRQVSPQALAGWGRHTRGPFAVRWLPEDHFFLNDPALQPLLWAYVVEAVGIGEELGCATGIWGMKAEQVDDEARSPSIRLGLVGGQP